MTTLFVYFAFTALLTGFAIVAARQWPSDDDYSF